VRERVVELADDASLSSVLLAKQANVGSDVALLGVLPTALAALSDLLVAVVGGVGQTVCSDDASAAVAPTLLSPGAVAPSPLDRSSAVAWRGALDKLRGDELAVLLGYATAFACPRCGRAR
jgi:hypothetical protein